MPQDGADKIVEVSRSRWDKQMPGRCVRDDARDRAEIAPRSRRLETRKRRRDVDLARDPLRSRDDITCIVMDFTHQDVQ